jgi:hypothetical protein
MARQNRRKASRLILDDRYIDNRQRADRFRLLVPSTDAEQPLSLSVGSATRGRRRPWAFAIRTGQSWTALGGHVMFALPTDVEPTATPPASPVATAWRDTIPGSGMVTAAGHQSSEPVQKVTDGP